MFFFTSVTYLGGAYTEPARGSVKPTARCPRSSRHWPIGGPGGSPRKVRSHVAFNGYFVHNTGTLRVQMMYIWVQMFIFVSKLCPPNSRGDLRGLCPRNRHLLPPMGQCLPGGLSKVSFPHLSSSGLSFKLPKV